MVRMLPAVLGAVKLYFLVLVRATCLDTERVFSLKLISSQDNPTISPYRRPQ